MKRKTLNVRTANYAEPTVVELSVEVETGFIGSDTTLEDLIYDEPDGGF